MLTLKLMEKQMSEPEILEREDFNAAEESAYWYTVKDFESLVLDVGAKQVVNDLTNNVKEQLLDALLSKR